MGATVDLYTITWTIVLNNLHDIYVHNNLYDIYGHNNLYMTLMNTTTCDYYCRIHRSGGVGFVHYNVEKCAI